MSSYKKRVKKAKENPDTILSFIVDGMDQSKCNIPHLKDIGFANAMTQHLTGSLMHGDNSKYICMYYL